ncbi:unnamed protein product, partial [Didymodactylos carnosus]
IDLAYCVGQGYDGCSAMSALSDSCDIRAIQNTIGTIKETYKFVRSSSVRTQLFEELAHESNEKRKIVISENIAPSSTQISENKTIELKCRKVKLANFCPTRWVDRHVAIETFSTLFPAVIELLTNLMQSKDKNVSTRSNLLYGGISSSEFLCSLPILNKILSFTINVSLSIKDRFNEHVKKAAAISSIIPQYIADKIYDDLAPAIEIYQNFLPGSISQIKSEFLLWKPTATVTMKRKETTVLPDTAIDAYIECNEVFYPNIKILLKIFGTLPVTTATTERTFSVLKLLKNYLRSTVSETRLNGLAMMYVYRDIHIEVDSVIDEFSKSNRRLVL